MKVKNRFDPDIAITEEELKFYREENRAWQGVPSIARTRGGRLFVSFFSGGIYEPDPRNCALFIYSDDNGESWSDPFLVIKSQPDKCLRRGDPSLWIAPNGALWIFWNVAPYRPGLSLPTYEQKIDMENDSEYHAMESQDLTYAAICEDPDADELVFGEPRMLFSGIKINKPYVTDSGRWLFPAMLPSERAYYEFFYSDDQGKTLHAVRRYGRAPGRAYDEPNFYRMPDGAIGVIVRTTPPMYKRMVSTDDGLTWSEPEDFLEAASQRPCTATLRDGNILLIPSIHKKSRNGLRLMRSFDGIDFSEVMVIDDRERVSYPEVIEDEEGTLYIVYDRERNNKIRKSRVTGYSEAAKEILFARIPRAALEAGEVTPDTVRARVITKARINALDNIFTKEN